MVSLAAANERIRAFADVMKNPSNVQEYKGKLFAGVDLGTANIVAVALDEDFNPLLGAMEQASVVRDGLVIDYVGAIGIVKRLVHQIELNLGRSLEIGATGIPPGTGKRDSEAIVNVVESCGIEVNVVVDEPTAAATVLGISDGVVVDVGGGTTGLSVIEGGKVIFSADEPTGGTHFSLVLAGNFNTSFDEAERMKKDPLKYDEVFPVVKPVIEKVASIIKKYVAGIGQEHIFLVGGTCCLDGFEDIVARETGLTVLKPVHPLLVTPLGIAMCAGKRGDIKWT